MRKLFLLSGFLSITLFGMTACNDANDEFDKKGSCSILSLTGQESVYMGDSISFSFQLSSTEVPINQAHVQLLFDTKVMSERLITVSENGATYSAKIEVPFLSNIPDGTARLVLSVQNERFAKASKEIEVQVLRPKGMQVTFVSSDNKSYPMTASAESPYEYVTAADANLSSDVEGYIQVAKFGENGNAMTFGNLGGFSTKNETGAFEFMLSPTNKQVKFNALTFDVSPMVKLALNGIEFTQGAGSEAYVDTDMEQNGEITISGLKKEWSSYWIDPAWFNFKKNTDKKVLKFKAITGKYRFTVDREWKYIRVETLNGNDYATLTSEGAQAVWWNGDAQSGKPSKLNGCGWSENKFICMTPIEKDKYVTIMTCGEQLGESPTIKIFHQRAVDDNKGAFNNTFGRLGCTDNIQDKEGDKGGHIYINSANNGNIKTRGASKFVVGNTYKFTVIINPDSPFESSKIELDYADANPEEVD